ncbi:Rv3235 family protein [Tsukamurella ocularis]
MGAIILAADGARTRAPDTPVPSFVVLRAPDAEPSARPLSPVRAERAAPPLPAPSETAPAEAACLPGPVPAVHPDAHRFVLSTLRPVFEVLDRRRPAKHLAAIASGTVVDVLRALAETGPAGTVSGWGNVHVATPRALAPRPRRPRGPDLGAEIFLTYTRGERVLAAAGRVEAAAGRWRWVAFTTAA